MSRQSGARPLDSGDLPEIKLDALREIGNIGAGTAATALATLTGAPVEMAVPRVTVLPIERVPELFGGDEALVAAVFLPVFGDVSGHMLFLMSEEAAHSVADAMLGDIDGGEPVLHAFGEMKLSALQEMGNIITSSYLCAIAEMTGLHLEPGPPALGVDMAGALLAAALAEAAVDTDVALVIETAFTDGESPAAGEFLFIPEGDSVGLALARLGIEE